MQLKQNYELQFTGFQLDELIKTNAKNSNDSRFLRWLEGELTE